MRPYFVPTALALLCVLSSPALAQDTVDHAGHTFRTPDAFGDRGELPDFGMPFWALDPLAELTPELRALAAQGVLGLQFEVDAQGLRVTRAIPGLPAARAGIEAGDWILEVAGVPVSTADALRAQLMRDRSRESVAIRVERDGWHKALTVVPWSVGGLVQGGQDRLPDRYRLAVLLVDFRDAKHDERFTREAYEQLLFSDGTFAQSVSGETVHGSMRDFYQESSAGAFDVVGTVFDWVSVGVERAAAEGQEPQPFSDNVLQQAIGAVEAREGRGALLEYDGFCMVYAGARGGHGTILWPHRSVLFHDGHRYDYYVHEAQRVRVNLKAVEGEEEPVREEFAELAPVGVHCHEFGHLIGLPDRYGWGRALGAGSYCLMAVGDRGFHKTGARRPSHPCAHCKTNLGWLRPVVLDARKGPLDERIALRPVYGRNAEAFCIRISDRESFLLENRGGQGFETDFKSPGLLIWHVGEALREVRSMLKGPSIDLEASHGIVSIDAARRKEAVTFPQDGKTAFTPDTTPSSSSIDPYAHRVSITEIVRHEDGTVTLRVQSEAPRGLDSIADWQQFGKQLEKAYRDSPLNTEEGRNALKKELGLGE